MTYGNSGGPMESFREGWAIIPFVRKPHYWHRRELTTSYRSLCGLFQRIPTRNEMRSKGFVSASQQLPLEPGVFIADRCKRCDRKHQGRLHG